MEVQHPLARGVLLHDGEVPVRRALRLARGTRGVVDDRVVVHAGVGGLVLVRRVRHQGLVAQVALGQRLLGAAVLVDDDDVLQGRQVGEHLRDALAEFRLRQEHRRAAVLHPVTDRVRPERREERADDRAMLEDTEHREVELR